MLRGPSRPERVTDTIATAATTVARYKHFRWGNSIALLPLVTDPPATSYPTKQPEPTRDVAALLTSAGYAVWWDANLTSGEIFREAIDEQLDAADAVIVIWTPHSISSQG
jgi:TIR domain